MEIEMEEYKELVKSTLREGPTLVTFTKKDGSTRTGTFTNNPEDIPASKAPKGNQKPKKVNEDLVRAFDVELQQFRTITISTISKIG
jgi:hypothetical protein